MGIKLKTFGVIGSVFLVSCLVTWVATVTLVQSQYINLEVDNVKKDTARTIDALDNKVNQLALKIPDWSSWNDAYQFTRDHNQAFIDSNLQSLALKNLSINFMLFIGTDQKLVYGIGVDSETGDTLPIPKELISALSAGSKLLTTTEASNNIGIIATSVYPLIITTRPLLHSDGTGPVGGTLVFAEYITPTLIANINSLTHLQATFDPATNSSGVVTDVAMNASNTSAITVTPNSETIYGYQLVNDIFGHPLLLAHVTEPRTIYQKTQRTLLFYMIAVLSVSLASILITNYTTDKIAIQKRQIIRSKATNAQIEKEVVERTREVKIEQARLSASINSLDMGFLITNANFELVTVNHAARKLFRKKHEDKELSHFNMDIVSKLLDGVDLKAILKTCLDSHKVVRIDNIEYCGRLLHLFAAPVLSHADDGRVAAVGCVVLLDDTTEASTVARSKDEFFSIASHELRTPLTAIRGNSSMMLQFYKDNFKDPDLKEMLTDIHSSSIRLITIVNDFLDVSRIEQGRIKYTLAELTISKIIENVIHDLKASQTDDRVQIVFDSKNYLNLPSILGDVDRVSQVIYNLVGNALKFTEKGTVTIVVHRVGDKLKTSVIDTGKGIPAESHKLLFHKFQQADTSILTRATPKGTGLGLYISKLLVEDMGGEISLDHSRVGVGSTFSFTLPIATKKLILKSQADQQKNNPSIDIHTGLTES